MHEVRDYLASLTPTQGDLFKRIYAMATELVGETTEGLSYGMPTLMYREKPLVSCMTARDHLSLFPFSGHIVEQVADKLEGFSLSKGTIRFSETQLIPDDVLRTIIMLRKKEIDTKLEK